MIGPGKQINVRFERRWDKLTGFVLRWSFLFLRDVLTGSSSSRLKRSAGSAVWSCSTGFMLRRNAVDQTVSSFFSLGPFLLVFDLAPPSAKSLPDRLDLGFPPGFFVGEFGGLA